jgi:hypothetical protein
MIEKLFSQVQGFRQYIPGGGVCFYPQLSPSRINLKIHRKIPPTLLQEVRGSVATLPFGENKYEKGEITGRILNGKE